MKRKWRIKRPLSLALLLVLITGLVCTLYAESVSLASTDPEASVTPFVAPTPISISIVRDQLQQSFPSAEAALQAALMHYIQRRAPGRAFEVTDLQSDQGWAYAIAQEVDARGQRVPYHFVVLLARQDPTVGWYAIAPYVGAPEDYNAWLTAFPVSVLDASTKARLHIPEPSIHIQSFGGHKLPWPAGQIGYVTTKDGDGHEHQVDFDILGRSVSGDVYASKPGTVVFVKESSSSGCCAFSCWQQANIVVVQHSDGEYSWYVHLAYNSVPVSVGDTIGFGTKVGIEGDTGYACGVHLHYMASSGHTPWTDPSDPYAAPWGTGITTVDFAEVSWADMVVGQGYISQNGGDDCPQSGGVILYKHANYDCGGEGEGSGYVLRSSTGWQNVPGSFNDQASSLRVPSGWSVRLYEHSDQGGASVCRSGDDSDFSGDYFDASSVPLNDNVSSFEVFSDSHCGDGGGDGIEVFDYTYYGGDSRVFPEGRYPNLCDYGWCDRIESIRFKGSYADGCYHVVLNDQFDFQGTPCHYDADCPEIGEPCRNRVRSMEIYRHAAGSPTPLSPNDGASFDEDDRITLCWSDTGDEYFGEIWGGPGGTLTFGWQEGTCIDIGTQWPGYTYQWHVKACDRCGESGWSPIQSFVVLERMPDLRPYTPPGYLYPVVPSSVTGTHEVDTLYAGQPTYFDWHWINDGDGIASGPFHIELWVGDTRYARYPYSDWASGWIGGFDDWLEVITQPGWHTVRLVVDPDDTVREADETNNTWERGFYWEESVQADFTADKTSGTAPLTVNFIDQSSGGVDTWHWDFGDGGISDEQSPTYIYDESGTYTVSLTACGPGGCDSESKPDYITVFPRTCHIRLNDDPTEYITVQAAVDASTSPDDVVKVAGYCSGVNSYGGLRQVVYISKTLTVRGGYTITNWTDPDPVANPTTLDAQGQGRVFYITGNVSPTVEGLSIIGGDAAGLGGGPQGYDVGGGVYILTATVTFRNNRVFGNVSPYHGGGLALCHSSATLSSNNISENSSKYAYSLGAGLYLYNSDATIDDNTISFNSDALMGGGVHIEQSEAILSGNTITSNMADGGGGICLYHSDALVVDNIVVSNTATQGGAILTSGGHLTLRNNTISANTASYDGGLYMAGGVAMLADNIIYSNTASSGSAGLSLWGSDTTLINNVIADNQTDGLDGAVYIGNSTLRMLHTTIVRNRSGDGSGLYVSNDSNVVLTNTIIASHTVGITVTASSAITLEGTLWYDNEQDSGGDGAIFTGTVNVCGDPAFLSPDIGDYHIGAASAAIDTGVDAGITIDIDGDPRPYSYGMDIGADEYVGPLPPSIDTFEPDEGSGEVGEWVTFTTTYSDPNGYEDIAWAFFFLDRQPPIAIGGLSAAYIQSADLLWLKGGGICWPGQAKVLATGTVRLDCRNTSVSGEGDMLTVTWRVRPEQCFEGGCGWNYAVEFVADSTGQSDAGLVGWWWLDPASGRARGTGARTEPTQADLWQLRKEVETWRSRLGE